MKHSINAIATVHNTRTEAVDDGWDAIPSEIRLHDAIPTEALDGIEAFSLRDIVYIFHKAVE